ncbi:CHAT domain-containing protein [Streptomyces sp. NBC_00035]|uniref:CHAT domain-containing protein n=1 Tax=Streptomyces sp. NBC_00035 TaxID=2903614 RepID=UPI00386A11B8
MGRAGERRVEGLSGITHITSAFLLAGFPAAVGTLWEIDSTHTDHVTRDFYRRTSGDTADTSAHALHSTGAVQRIRLGRRRPLDPCRRPRMVARPGTGPRLGPGHRG